MMPDTGTAPDLQTEFILNITGYEGPLDLLLAMARTQKVDLREINILELVECYLDFTQKAQALRIELAADYLVLAAWLAFLKSKLLLPKEEQDPEDPEQLAAYLGFQLERLAAMRGVAEKLMQRPRLGTDFHKRGLGETFEISYTYRYNTSIFDLLQAYARIQTREEFTPLHYQREAIMSMEMALERMRHMMGSWHEQRDILSFLPKEWQNTKIRYRSALASYFLASLQMVKEGEIHISQKSAFGQITLQPHAKAG